MPHRRASDASEPAPPSDDGELILPTPPAPPRRGGPPILAAVAPVAGAVVIWAVTGHVLALWLAALGPLIAVASFLDHRRLARRELREAERRADRARDGVLRQLGARHRHEREAAWRRTPDVSGYLADPEEIWRRSAAREAVFVVGRGTAPSVTRISGGGDTQNDRSIRAAASRLTDAPVLAPFEGGIAVAGPPILATAVVRALVLQLCLVHDPTRVELTLGPSNAHAWARGLPHRSASGVPVAVLEPGEHSRPGAAFVIARVDESAPSPPACAVRLRVRSPAVAELDDGSGLSEVVPEMVDAAQAAQVAMLLDRRAGSLTPTADPECVGLGALLEGGVPTRSGGLATVFVSADGQGAAIDLVEDGPHAVVAGITGSGKSELLISWIVALCGHYATTDVVFLLADFKGGTAFDALAVLPHVTGVITDLDGDGADRAIRSLRAEMRNREAELARCGARDVRDEQVRLPRLVIVVDEFAALLGDHPELQAVFTDVAARGRALGMHLILGTQRIAGVVRDALLANCPLRISLRVADRGDSRAVVGTDDAALIPGGRAGAGLAVVRRAGDPSPQRVRVALSDGALIASLAARESGPPPRRIWAPPLPERITREELGLTGDGGPGARSVLGLADDPTRQRQYPLTMGLEDRSLLILGRAGSGRTTAAAVLVAQARGRVWLDGDPERGWDELIAMSAEPPPPGTVIVLDEVDTLLSRFPPDYTAEALARIEAVVRDAAHHGHLVVATARRLTGPLARSADLFSRRLILASSGRAEHVAFGGEAADYLPDVPPGRGVIDGVRVQVAITAAPARCAPTAADLWRPPRGVSGLVAPLGPRMRDATTRWSEAGIRILAVEEAAGADPDGGRTVLVGDPETWQRNWRTLTRVRSEHDLVIDSACAPEYRTITGDRTLPPLCEPGRSRGWLSRRGGPPRRVMLVPAIEREG
ncbi:FtsK/SpoIIIE domain-containing protein [Microbacterium xanthum]|uniref:FtsK/SpoIIIE domain-containing protein n=1 Tax=Microbacterium xanthum TaxID=3079794 RepID=UPI002AD30E51|nr:FtsK/SpoIIIE domain-containing protein [Microbacterium sp. KSW-48]MDZ8171248.1 FtsK/SpoIIIE domain-containing protein [Microbacterium sp. KSW-48]